MINTKRDMFRNPLNNCQEESVIVMLKYASTCVVIMVEFRNSKLWGGVESRLFLLLFFDECMFCLQINTFAVTICVNVMAGKTEVLFAILLSAIEKQI